MGKKRFDSPPKRVMVPVNDKGFAIGEKHHRARLTDQDVEWILELHFDHGLSYKTLAEKFDCGRMTIADICTGKTRAQIPSAYKPMFRRQTKKGRTIRGRKVRPKGGPGERP